MSIFLLKSVLSLLILLLALFAFFTMAEILGLSERRFNEARMKRAHKTIGAIYLLIFIFIAYHCLSFIFLTKSELTPRSTFHSLFALAILVLFSLKFSVVRRYRQFYSHVHVYGLLMLVLSFGLVGTSGGYYFIVSNFGTDPSFDKIMQFKKSLASQRIAASEESVMILLSSDPQVIKRGLNLFNGGCRVCHDPESTETVVGPGLKGILRRDTLPVSGNRATPANIMRQMRNPFNRMPSFQHLTAEEMSSLVSYLATL